jgi:hypothetical protein
MLASDYDRLRSLSLGFYNLNYLWSPVILSGAGERPASHLSLVPLQALPPKWGNLLST